MTRFYERVKDQEDLQPSRGQILGTNTNDSASAGYIGEYISASVSGTPGSGTLGNTYIDATGLSITLSAGDWDVGYDIAVAMGNTGVTGNFYASVRLTDGSNNYIANSECLLSATPAISGDLFIFPTSKTVRISTATSITVKVRFRTNSTVNNAVRVVGGNWTGSLTDPDNASIIWARRVR